MDDFLDHLHHIICWLNRNSCIPHRTIILLGRFCAQTTFFFTLKLLQSTILLINSRYLYEKTDSLSSIALNQLYITLMTRKLLERTDENNSQRFNYTHFRLLVVCTSNNTILSFNNLCLLLYIDAYFRFLRNPFNVYSSITLHVNTIIIHVYTHFMFNTSK